MTWLSTHRAALWVFLLALLPGLVATVNVHRTAEMQARAEFDRVAELAVDRVVSRMRQHVVALRAGRGLWDALEGEVTRAAFIRFVDSVDLVEDLSGARAIGFAPMIAPADLPAVKAMIGETYGVRPGASTDTDQPWRTPVQLVEPATELTKQALGYDMYSDITRRAAMDAAIAANSARMTGPVNLVGGDIGQAGIGFLIFLPVSPGSGPRVDGTPPTPGFVYAAFGGQELIEAALASGPPLPVTLEVTDMAAPGMILHSDGADAAEPAKVIEIPILGRDWAFAVRPTGADNRAGMLARTGLMGLSSIVFAFAIAYAVAARQDEVASARDLAAAATRESEYRNLLVQEMKHRIKNYISRIQSIARQSARGATDVKAFTDTFDARLRAMASVQEILAGTAVAEADVRTILRKELQQCLDTEAVEHLMDGPSVRLDERQSHAFALVVHELVTNAMKYGGLSANGRGLKVTWSEEAKGPGQAPDLVITWREHFDEAAPAPHGGTGFGSRLIEASLKGELSGRLERDFLDDGLLVRLSFPVSASARPVPRAVRS